MSSAEMESLTETAEPSRVRAPVAGRLVMMTVDSESPSLSEKPKSGAEKLRELSSVMTMVLSLPAGASLTAVMAVERLRVAAEISVELPLVEISTLEALVRVRSGIPGESGTCGRARVLKSSCRRHGSMKASRSPSPSMSAKTGET